MNKATIAKRANPAKKPAFIRIPFVPDRLQLFAARRLMDGIAFAVCGAGVFLLLALISYSNTDPSLNAALTELPTTEDGELFAPANWMGGAGAVISDLLLQTIGFAAYLPALCLSVWGWRLWRRMGLSAMPLRLVAIMSASLLGAIGLALIPSFDLILHPYLGSSAGTILLARLNELASMALPTSIYRFIGPVVISLTCALMAIALFVYAAGFTVNHVSRFLQVCTQTSLYIISQMAALMLAFTSWLRTHNPVAARAETYELAEEDEAPQGSLFSWPRFRLNLFKGPVSDLELEGDEEDDFDEKPARKTPRPKTASREKSAPVIPVKSAPAEAEKPKAKATREAPQKRFALQEDGQWELPPLDLLQEPPAETKTSVPSEDALRKNAELLQNVLSDFSVQGDIVSIHPGPVVTLYELEPAPGTKSSRVISLSDDIARSMSAVSVRCAVVPGRNVIGIELPNKQRQFVLMRELLASRIYEKSTALLPLILGKDIGGQPIMADLAKMPHLLVAGTTGSGKSVAVNTMILSLLFRLSPEKCRFIMIDPKMLELSVYDDIPHLLTPVVTEPGKAIVALKWTVAEMEDRYRSMSKLGVRNIEGYNERLREARKKGENIMRRVQTGFDPETGQAIYEEQPMDLTELPYIVVVVDEFADLMLVAGKDVENAIQRLAQMARAAGIHLIMATQRPSVDVITGVIKANFPTRISFQVTSKIDSRTILGESGAEQLLGMGDMLYMAPGGRVTRVHGPFVSDDEVEDVVKYLKSQGKPAYLSDITENNDFGNSEIMNAIFSNRSGDGEGVDELYDQAVAIVAREGKVSTSFIQRHLQIGYNRAARIVEEMERQGVISKASATGKREILVQDFSDY